MNVIILKQIIIIMHKKCSQNQSQTDKNSRLFAFIYNRYTMIVYNTNSYLNMLRPTWQKSRYFRPIPNSIAWITLSRYP